MAVQQAMLMAAGLGTRLRPFTRHEPKALFPLLGVPVAQFALDSLARAGVRTVVANTHHMAERARAGLGRLDAGGAALLISDESDLLLGSAGGLRKALPRFGSDPFFLVNSDVLSDVDLGALASAHERLRARWGVTLTLAVFERGPGNGRYRELVLERASGLIRGLRELAFGKPFFIGSAVIEPEALSQVPQGGPAEFVPSILEPAIQAGKAGFHACSGVWKDIGSPALWLDAHLHLLRALERGTLHRAWRLRLERVNRRIGQEIWVSKGSPRLIRGSEWAGPSYWDGRRSEIVHVPCRALGPRAVLYGSVPESGHLESGIGFQGEWVQITDRS